ncbi:LapA family protein [Desulfonatronum thiodismutans]|uniref:LapA family protein n=1 Tax=Desulfonatronum thiodismutans TaxID=159290 RepID=UPI0004ABD51C|nr:LapA family protein [Desulfonatronum thiodismutans]
MRYLKVLLLTLFFFVSMVFFIQNNEMLSNELVLKLELFDLSFVSRELPFYLIVLVSFVVGSVFSMSYFLAEKIRLAHELKSSKAKLAALEQEVTSLRNLPLEEEVYPSSASKTENTSYSDESTQPYSEKKREESAA